MSLLKWIVGGAIGGLVGAGIWGAVGYYSGYEVGWIAWGVGVLVGLGVRAAAQDQDGYGPGVVATAVAVGAVVLGKYLAVSWAVSGMTAEWTDLAVTDAHMIASIADEIVDEREAAGQEVNWPDEVGEDAPIAASYPPELWAEAEKKWSEVPPNEMQSRIEERKQHIAEFSATIGGALKEAAFRESFAAWDLLWLALAAFTAFKLGSGLQTGD